MVMSKEGGSDSSSDDIKELKAGLKALSLEVAASVPPTSQWLTSVSSIVPVQFNTSSFLVTTTSANGSKSHIFASIALQNDPEPCTKTIGEP